MCKRVVYDGHALICLDDGTVIDDAPIMLEAYYNVVRTSEGLTLDHHWLPTVAGNTRSGGDKEALEVCRLYEEGLPLQEIMAQLGIRSCSLLYQILDACGVRRRRGRYRSRGRLSREEVAEICRLHSMGWSISDIAKKLRRPPSTIHYAIKRWCKEGKEQNKEPVEELVNKLLEEKNANIPEEMKPQVARELYRRGYSYKMIARLLGIDTKVVKQIIRSS